MDPAKRSTCEELLQHPYFDREVYSEASRRQSQRYQLNNRVGNYSSSQSQLCTLACGVKADAYDIELL